MITDSRHSIGSIARQNRLIARPFADCSVARESDEPGRERADGLSLKDFDGLDGVTQANSSKLFILRGIIAKNFYLIDG
jgi:hypothetical protein